MNSVFNDVPAKSVEALVEFIQAAGKEQLGIAKSSRKDYTIPKGETKNISCRVNHAPIASHTPVIFEPDELHPWPSGRVIPGKLLAVKQGKSSQIEIEVTNTTKHDILLPYRTVLGRVELVQSVTPNDAAGYSPFYLLFGRHPWLPIDLIFSIDLSTKHQSYPQYVSTWKTAMENAYKFASKKSGARAKEYYDRKLCSSVLQPNDRVLVRNLSERGGPGKLRAHWEDQIHRIVWQRGPDSPVYEVKPETGTCPARVLLHRNLLLPCDSLPLDSDFPKKVPTPKQESKQVPSGRQRQFKHQLPPRLRSQVMQDPVDEESSSDEDNLVVVWRPTRPSEKSPCSTPLVQPQSLKSPQS